MATLELDWKSGGSEGGSFRSSAKVRITYTASNGTLTITEVEGYRADARSWNVNQTSITIKVGGTSKSVSLGHCIDFNTSYTSWKATDTSWTGLKGTSISVEAIMPSSSSAYGGAVFSDNATMSWSKYTVSYSDNVSNATITVPSDQIKTHGTNLTLSSTQPTRTGYTFNNWNTSSNGTGTSYSAGGSYTSNADATLYAQWTANTYTVRYNANGGTGSTPSSSHSYNTAKNLTANAFTRTGYRFTGWSESADSDVKYDDQASVKNLTSTNGGTVDLYAQWTAETYTVTLDNQGAAVSGTVEVTVTYDDEIPSINVPSKTGYTFKGYYIQAEGVGKQYYKHTGESIGTWDRASDTRLYAYWSRNQYQLTLDANGGKIKDDLTYSYNVYYEYPLALNDEEGLPTPIRPGYNFVGWNTQRDGKGVTLTRDSKMGAEALTLYAQWEPAASIITIYVDGNKRRGMVHMYNDEGQLCYGIMTIYNENRVGHFAG